MKDLKDPKLHRLWGFSWTMKNSISTTNYLNKLTVFTIRWLCPVPRTEPSRYEFFWWFTVSWKGQLPFRSWGRWVLSVYITTFIKRIVAQTEAKWKLHFVADSESTAKPCGLGYGVLPPPCLALGVTQPWSHVHWKNNCELLFMWSHRNYEIGCNIEVSGVLFFNLLIYLFPPVCMEGNKRKVRREGMLKINSVW